MQRIFNRYSHIVLFIICFIVCDAVYGQAPKWQKKARKTMLTLITYDDKGQILHTTNGFYIHNDGTAIADYHSFKDATSAIAFDEEGKSWPVECILGANSLYDVVKIKVGSKKTNGLTIAEKGGQQGNTAFILPYLTNNKTDAIATSITNVSTFNSKYDYYTLPTAVPEKWTSCPVMNEAGQVIGILQMSALPKDTCCYAVSIRFAEDLHTQALSMTAADYQAIHIKKALPEEASQAYSFIYLMGNRDTTAYLNYVEDFITRFPEEVNGYIMKAEMMAAKRLFEQAEASWNEGLKKTKHEADIHYSRANTIYQTVQAGSAPEYWTLDTALSELENTGTQQQPVYTALKAKILYSKKLYEEACKEFLDLNKTNLRSADNFLYAAQCRQMLGDTTAVLALQDSAIACYTLPYVEAAAPALLMRSTTLISMGRYREAVRDLNDYEHLKSNELNANFYYRREQAEMRCRMFQQAIDDIERAIRMEPREPLFHAEAAAVYYRIHQLDDAVREARAAIAIDDRFQDAYRILGVCLRAQQKEDEAREALQHAADLGDEIAKGMLQQ